jgi:16S rRNA (uracil1498-N3)-methyltransferase
MYHFFVTPDSFQGQQVTFTQKIAHQIRHVLRLQTGDQVAVLDNSGMMYTVILKDDPAKSNLKGQVVKAESVTSEPSIHLALFFGLSSREKVEMILQKGTEIGVASFHPFISSRTLVNTTTLSKTKHERWARIIQEAAEQSGRGKLPVLNGPINLKDGYFTAKDNYDFCLMAWERATNDDFTLMELRNQFSGKSIALFVGPEGGFSDEEAAAARDVGCQIISLGARILRMETAAIVFPALVLHELGML